MIKQDFFIEHIVLKVNQQSDLSNCAYYTKSALVVCKKHCVK